ncbi:MAG: glycosyltransferase family 4 protein [Thermoguttaceae bacterium]
MAVSVFVLGYPGHVGGANTELWHTVKLWRHLGCDVTLVPTWKADPPWQARLDAIGCRTISAGPDTLRAVAGLPEGIVVGMCNLQFLACGRRLRELGCRTVWVSCMNWLFPAERLLYRRLGTFDRHVFQSRYQRDQLVPQLRRYGFQPRQGVVLRGALGAEEFPFQPRPHAPGEAFTVGRISRAEPDKFAPNLWRILGRVPHPLAARVLGWGSQVEARVGPPPPWAKCFAAGSLPVGPFLQTLHALLARNDAAVENWPRVGLEAMAAGVPVVAEAQGGWNEMIRHGQTGYLAHTDDELAYYTARLAYDEEHRLAIARQARAALIEQLADPTVIGQAWLELFGSLATDAGLKVPSPSGRGFG